MNKIKKIYSDDYLKKYLNNIPKINKYDIYKGNIVNILDDYVIIDFGYKSEGIIPLNEFKKEKIKKKDKKDIMIMKLNFNGNCLLSYEKAKKYKSWIKLQKYFKEQKKVKGYIISRTKGGFIINLFNNISCFLPGSQTDINIIKDYDYYVGRNINVQILNINYKTKNVIVSHKILIEKKIKLKKKEIINKLKIGQIIKGKIKNILSYGMFIDLGGIDGLLHITDISWKRNENIINKFKIGDKYNFIILGIDKKNLRIQLGLKQLTTNPWDILIKKINIGKIITGIVTAITDYGAFLEIKEGIEGLLHVSEMSWDQQLKTAKNFVKIGQKLKCIILNIDKDDKKIFLSTKRLEKDPWNDKIKDFIIGNKYKGTISKILKNNYGLEIKLNKNIYGILLNNDIIWESNIENLSLNYKIGDKIKVKIISIDNEKRKIYLSHKDLLKNKWEKYKKIFKINSIHKGYVYKINKNIIILKNNEYNKLNFYIYYKYFKKIKFEINKIIDFKILDYNIKYKKIIVVPYIKNKKINSSTYGDLYELNIIKKKIKEEEEKNN